jgi:hypothetical protein
MNWRRGKTVWQRLKNLSGRQEREHDLDREIRSACLISGRRASRIHPMVALLHE